MNIKSILISLFIGVSGLTSSYGQYNEAAAKSVIMEDVEETYFDKDIGEQRTRIVTKEVASDTYGNAQGNQYDLAVDGAFQGQTIAVLHFCARGAFNFKLPKQALAEKGFSVCRWMNAAPSPAELQKGLDKACQLWIISDTKQNLNAEHLKVIKAFFESGKGVYIWGDNQPFYADANYVSKALIGIEMEGDTRGDKTVGLQMENKKAGVTPNHLITTGIQTIYEGITVATLPENEDLTPIIYGSANNLITAVYEKDGKRLIVDGGFTRLYKNWATSHNIVWR